MHHTDTPKLFGLMAEFDSASAIVEAARRAREAGYVKLDAYTPLPIHELDDALKLKRTGLPWLVFGAGVTGCVGGFVLQYWTSLLAYPFRVGGRPILSWPSFVVPSYELTILFAAFTAGIAMLALNGLPRPYHPTFNVPAFARATQDRYFLTVEAADPKFDLEDTRAFLQGLKPLGVADIEE